MTIIMKKMIKKVVAKVLIANKTIKENILKINNKNNWKNLNIFLLNKIVKKFKLKNKKRL